VIGDAANKVLSYSFAGSEFVFGPLGKQSSNIGFIFAFQVLPVVIFICALFAILYHVGIMQFVIRIAAWLMIRIMGASGAESLNVAASIFMGQTEAPVTIRPFLPGATRSELMTIMTSGMAHVSGGIMAAYILYGIEAEHLLAAVIMTAWDFAQDPVWSTLLHAWRWRDGGRWFGVPLTNYTGWLLTVFLICFAFAQYLRRFAATIQHASPHWRAAVTLYALCALGNVLQLLRPQPLDVVADPAGAQWHTTAILRASALVSIFLMGSLALLAWVRIPKSRNYATD